MTRWKIVTDVAKIPGKNVSDEISLKSYVCLFQLPHSFWNIPDSKLFFRIYFVMNELKCTTIFTSLSAVILSTSVTGYEYGNKSCRLVTFYTLTGDECCSIFALRVRWRVLAWAPYALPAALRRLLNKMRLHYIITFYWFSKWSASAVSYPLNRTDYGLLTDLKQQIERNWEAIQWKSQSYVTASRFPNTWKLYRNSCYHWSVISSYLLYYLELSVISSLETQIKHWFSFWTGQSPPGECKFSLLVILGDCRCVLRYLWIGKMNEDTSVRSKHIQTNIWKCQI